MTTVITDRIDKAAMVPCLQCGGEGCMYCDHKGETSSEYIEFFAEPVYVSDTVPAEFISEYMI